MSLIRSRIRESFSSEQVAEMRVAGVAHDFDASGAISFWLFSHLFGEVRPEARPAASTVELVLRKVERRGAGGANVDASGNEVLIVLAAASGIGSLLTQNIVLVAGELCLPLSVGEIELSVFFGGKSGV